MEPNCPVKVLHVSAWRESLGGIQSVLAQHRRLDMAKGIRPAFISVFDPVNTWEGEARTLAFGGWGIIGKLKREFAKACAGLSPDIAVYHDGWGLPWFAPLDGAQRRLLFLHTERPHLETLLRRSLPFVDGVISVSEACLGHLRKAAPGFPEERVFVAPYKVEPPSWVSATPVEKKRGASKKIGYAGRVESGHKRLDRLPALLERLDALEVDWTFEVLGEGSYLETLKKRLGGDSRVLFRGVLRGDAYWQALGGWDAMVFLSDYEGMSRAALEGMCLGLPVVHPDFSPAARELLGADSATLLYPVGDMAAAAACLTRVVQMTPEEMLALGTRLAELAGPHRSGAHERAFSDALGRLLALPPLAQPQAKSDWRDRLPLGLYTRLNPTHF